MDTKDYELLMKNLDDVVIPNVSKTAEYKCSLLNDKKLIGK